jgi:hypothetical protein
VGVSRHNVRRKIKCRIDSQHMAMWQGLISPRRQARKLISGPNPTAKTISLSFNRIQDRVVTCLLTGYNILKRHFYIMGLIDGPLYRGCGADEETSAHVCVSVKP